MTPEPPPPIPDYFDWPTISRRPLELVDELSYCRSVIKYNTHLLRPKPMDELFVGYDPGSRNAGLATLNDGKYLNVWQIVWGDMSGPEEEMHYACQVIKWLVRGLILYGRPDRAVVENASQGSPFGQAELANNRAAAVIGLWEAGYKVKLEAPATISKQVLKYGRRRVKDEWGHLFGEDGATAAACALLAAGLV